MEGTASPLNLGVVVAIRGSVVDVRFDVRLPPIFTLLRTGLFPAIDPLQSSSKMATPGIIGDRHYRLAQDIRRTLAQYADLKDMIAMLGLEQLSPEDRCTVGRARRLERFLTQPFFTTEQFTGLAGKLVTLKDALDGCERILHDEFKDLPETALYMIGTIDEVKRRAPATLAAPP